VRAYLASDGNRRSSQGRKKDRDKQKGKDEDNVPASEESESGYHIAAASFVAVKKIERKKRKKKEKMGTRKR
jgi:hypothetical protein